MINKNVHGTYSEDFRLPLKETDGVHEFFCFLTVLKIMQASEHWQLCD